MNKKTEAAAETVGTANEAAETAQEPVNGSKEWYEEKVTLHLFKDQSRYKEDLQVGVNGKIWNIKRGVDVEVPRYVAEIALNSMDQDQRTAELMELESTEFSRSDEATGK